MQQSQIIQILWYWILLNVFLTVGSIFLHYVKSKKSISYKKKLREDFVNIKIAIVNLGYEFLTQVVGISTLALALYFFSENVLFKIVWSPVNFFLCFILVDFFYYLSHLGNHKIQFFWNQHQVHHSSQSYSLSTGYRKAWLTALVNWIFYLPLGILGFPVEMILLNLMLITSYTHLLHTEKIKQIPYLEYIFNTPVAHSIHHSAYEKHLDKNMAGIFMFWDHIFNTFSLEESEKVKYGLTQPSRNKSVFYINFQNWILIKNIFIKKGLKEAVRVLLKNPKDNQLINTNPEMN